MNILLIGSGGREHTLAWKMAQSPGLSKLFIAPGNAGTAQMGTNVNLDPTDFKSLKEFLTANAINLVVVGPEAPLVAGVHDFIAGDTDIKHIPVIGPKKRGAALEGSKQFAKEFMLRHAIPTARYRSFTKADLQDGYAFLESLAPPYVLKADGLAAGKGVVILNDIEAAKQELKDMLAYEKFGKASEKVVIEEFLDGIELSCFVLTDGKEYVILPEAKDYKRIGEGDTGLNTGGMGAVSPVPFADKALLDKIEQKIIKPTIQGLQEDGIDFIGFVFFGLIKVKGEPFVIEYNVRLGDPETEVIIPRLKTDLVSLFKAAVSGKLKEIDVVFDQRAATTVMLVSGGYPEAYEKCKRITGIETVRDSIVFHAGTKIDGNAVLSNGGRVLAVTSYGDTVQQALQKSYKSIASISFDTMNYRRDIGFDL
ncbi:MAG: phosphoribosylamine--glycine ligase [Flavobacteriaceae bacterium]|nr:phosphoribosylamine--glycine ligase [Flavobacteriaceae bacterium]